MFSISFVEGVNYPLGIQNFEVEQGFISALPKRWSDASLCQLTVTVAAVPSVPVIDDLRN